MTVGVSARRAVPRHGPRRDDRCPWARTLGPASAGRRSRRPLDGDPRAGRRGAPVGSCSSRGATAGASRAGSMAIPSRRRSAGSFARSSRASGSSSGLRAVPSAASSRSADRRAAVSSWPTGPSGELRPGGLDVGLAGTILVVGARVDAETLDPRPRDGRARDRRRGPAEQGAARLDRLRGTPEGRAPPAAAVRGPRARWRASGARSRAPWSACSRRSRAATWRSSTTRRRSSSTSRTSTSPIRRPTSSASAADPTPAARAAGSPRWDRAALRTASSSRRRRCASPRVRRSLRSVISSGSAWSSPRAE